MNGVGDAAGALRVTSVFLTWCGSGSSIYCDITGLGIGCSDPTSLNHAVSAMRMASLEDPPVHGFRGEEDGGRDRLYVDDEPGYMAPTPCLTKTVCVVWLGVRSS